MSSRWGNAIESPCIKVCVIAPVAGLCSGCGRTLDEIARWGSMSVEQRWAIMAMLPARMAANGLPKPAAQAP